jgi:hypothetical protein
VRHLFAVLRAAMSKINRITGVNVIGDTQLELHFDDDFIGRIDLGPALWGPVFEPLKKAAYF